MKKKNIAVFITVLILLTATAFTPVFSQFGKNKVQYKIFDWKLIQTEHFDIYFDKSNYNLAVYTAHVAESSLVSLSRNLDYNIFNRIPLIVFASHNEFQQNNIIDELLPEGVGGVTELFKNRVLVPFEGSFEQFRHVIHHELVHAFINDMFYGGSIQNIISKNITLNLPLWFNEGMAEVQSLNGLDKATDMYIRDAILNNNLPPIEYNYGYLAYRGGQSFFNFLIDQYGDIKIGELMNNIRAIGDFDMAFKETYKHTVPELSEKWLKELKKEHWPEIAVREDVKDIGKMLTNHMNDGGFYNISPVISPKGDKFAFISNRSDFFSLYLADVNSGEIIDKVIQGNTTNDFEELQVLTPGLSWSPDGRYLAISVKSGDRDAIYVIDVENGGEERLPVLLSSISYVKWSPFKNIIAFVGTDGKQSDLYTYNISKNSLKRMTDDIFSDFSPSWTADGKYIYFSSDRGAYVTKESIPADFKMWEHDVNMKDLYRIEVETGKITRITNTKYTENTYANFSDDGKKVLYVSDRNGISNIYFGQWDSAGTYSERPITNSISPIDQISLSKDGKKLLFVSLNEGGYDIFSMDNPFDRKISFDTLPPTQFVKRQQNMIRNLSFKDTLSNLVKSLFNDSADIVSGDTLRDSAEINSGNIAMTDSLGNPQVKVDSDTSSITGLKTIIKNIRDSLKAGDTGRDSMSLYGSDIKLKFNDKKEKNNLFTRNEDSLYLQNANFRVSDNLNEDGSFRIKNYKIKFTPDIVYGNANYSSYYGVQGVAQISLSDMLGNHRLTFLTSMVIDLKNSDYAFAYQYLPKRIDYGFEIYHTARFVYYDRGYGFTELYRYRTIGTDFSLSYPFNRFKRIDAAASLMRITRENLDFPEEPMEQKYLIVPAVSLVHDNVLYGYLYPEKGSRYNITSMFSPRILAKDGSEFFTLMGDFRQYFKLGENYSVAFRFSGGSSFGQNPMRFYLGGIDNWINWTFEDNYVPFGESIDNFAFATMVTPLRGYNYNARTGSKFVLGNIEMRFPIFRYLIFGALPLGFQDIMGLIFADAGSAWYETENLQFVSKSSSGSSVFKDLLFSTGVGSRIVFLGFPIRLDIAWRYNMQRFSAPEYMFSLGLDY
ncbi:MAG: biopolymer transporter Tol [Ignavibacteria bacterium]|nr:biopolymer transporter Tol [Ignavibacteria bacterium]